MSHAKNTKSAKFSKTGSKTIARVAARKHAFNLVFSLPFFPEHTLETLQAAIDRYLADLPDFDEVEAPPPTLLDEEARVYIQTAAVGVFLHRGELDTNITQFLKGWELGRLASTDLAILRLALYEVHYRPEISTATSINQAVELAKLYSPDESPSFINGLLGQAVREL